MEFKEIIHQVERFHKAFHIENHNVPTLLNDKEAELRYNLTLLRHGLQDKIEEVFLEIQKSNMSKLDAQGKPVFREDGKVLKSDLYFKPNIGQFFKKGSFPRSTMD
ncbi:MAG: hypothetical protein EB023_02450 [Flavobacteriia bacterium]|nr:hypothetical protein [Flavobacteriia bacterium]